MASQSLQDIVCCMGQPVAGNPAQFMMAKAFAAADLDWRYLTLEVSPEDLGDAVRGMRAMGFTGGNFIAPHTVPVIEFLDELTEAARLIGAVNCVYRDEEKLVGDDTDGKGFLQSLAELTDPSGKRVVVLGAGGAARSIAVELALAGASRIVIVNQSEERGRELVDLLQTKVETDSELVVWKGDYNVEEGTDILINATSIGMGDADARVPLKIKTLGPETIVADAVVSPPQTRLLREAADHGCPVLDGLGMLVNQGAIAFKIWTGVDPDVAILRDAAEEFLGA